MITQEQKDTLDDFNRLESEHLDRVAVKEMAHNTQIAIRQILTREQPNWEDFTQLEAGIPGMIKPIATHMGFSVKEFRQQLDKGLTLDERVKSMLESMLSELPNLA